MSFLTPPSSPVKVLSMGSPFKRSGSLFGEVSPKKVQRSNPWIEKVKKSFTPTEMSLPLTPTGVETQGDFSKVKFMDSPVGPIVTRELYVGMKSKTNPNGTTPEGLHLVNPNDFIRQVDSLNQELLHVLSPIAIKGEEVNDMFRVEQIFPAGIPLDEFVKTNPEQAEEFGQKWYKAVKETVETSGSFVVDPKPQNAVIIDNEVKLIDFELISEEQMEDDEVDFADILSGRYVIESDDQYETALQMGLLDMMTGFSLTKEELHKKFFH